ncbi:hypothetical protein CTAM01_17029 [Colletotrichum tamarilloi]|uniref:Phosphoglycerate mutase n=1 Tax=Colletotrichum tamarilloi TaxID=1209934 RepID=A0ABQ9QGU3_9PEZI|nr:uncharacterized protein CTAM01_17029 [Colletotrichum tamarilloi]KAK1466167.1 hypothetical protein CTAM01_17029 [Colletotrichum tamarilloi]
MSDRGASTPRVFCIRHGETEWSREGRFTGVTEIDLTSRGAQQASDVGELLFGGGKLVDPARLANVIVSPRKRAERTLEKLLPSPLKTSSDDVNLEAKIITDKNVAEWDYGKYEGKTDKQIRCQRQQQGLDKEDAWNIWRDGCEGGESKKDVTERLLRLIVQIRKIQEPHMKGDGPGDVLVVSHGLILRCFWKLWNGFEIDHNISIDIETTGMFVLGYKGNDINKRSFYLGVSLPLAEHDGERESQKKPRAIASETPS